MASQTIGALPYCPWCFDVYKPSFISRTFYLHNFYKSKRKGLHAFDRVQVKPFDNKCYLNSKSKFKADVTQRTDFLTWDQYFMGVALISAQTNKDKKTQVGACIVNPKKRIVGVGYHEMQDRGIVKRGQDAEDKQEDKDLYVFHAEMNAIVNKVIADLQDCKIYTTLYPCNECSKMIIQSGIKKVVYFKEEDPGRETYAASRRLLETANIKIKKYKPKGNWKRLEDEFKKAVKELI